jgi:hypothetical protein
MPSRKIRLLGAGALALLVVLVVLVARGGGGPSFKVERGDGAEFPLRGSLADDRDAIDGALQAWKDGRGAAADIKAARISSEDVHLLYAETIGERSVVVVRQGDRLIAMDEPLDRGWYVEAAVEGFDHLDGSPAKIGDAVLLPNGDWTYLPLRDSGEQTRTVDGLVTPDSAYGDLEPGFVVEGRQPSGEKVTKVYDTEVGLFRVDARTRRAIAAAALQPGALPGDPRRPRRRPGRAHRAEWAALVRRPVDGQAPRRAAGRGRRPPVSGPSWAGARYRPGRLGVERRVGGPRSARPTSPATTGRGRSSRRAPPGSSASSSSSARGGSPARPRSPSSRSTGIR